jgi:hypothetical protein
MVWRKVFKADEGAFSRPHSRDLLTACYFISL